MTEVTQHVTRFEKGYGTCNSDWVSESSKNVDSELYLKGQKEPAKRTEKRMEGHPGFIMLIEIVESLIEHVRPSTLPIRMLRVETLTSLPMVGGVSVPGCG